MSDLNKTTYLPEEMAEEIQELKKYIGSGGTNLDKIAFGEMTEEELRENLTNPGLTDPKYYEEIAEAILKLTKDFSNGFADDGESVAQQSIKSVLCRSIGEKVDLQFTGQLPNDFWNGIELLLSDILVKNNTVYVSAKLFCSVVDYLNRKGAFDKYLATKEQHIPFIKVPSGTYVSENEEDYIYATSDFYVIAALRKRNGLPEELPFSSAIGWPYTWDATNNHVEILIFSQDSNDLHIETCLKGRYNSAEYGLYAKPAGLELEFISYDASFGLPYVARPDAKYFNIPGILNLPWCWYDEIPHDLNELKELVKAYDECSGCDGIIPVGRSLVLRYIGGNIRADISIAFPELFQNSVVLDSIEYIPLSVPLGVVSELSESSESHSTDLYFPENMAQALLSFSIAYDDNELNKLQTGTIVFHGANGKVLYSYDRNEFLSIGHLPYLPEYEKIISEKWSWELDDIKSFIKKTPSYFDLHVGVYCKTADDSTQIRLILDENFLSPYLGFCINGTAMVDWGDDTPESIVTGNSLENIITLRHDYIRSGVYDITIHAESTVVLHGDPTILTVHSSAYPYLINGNVGNTRRSVPEYVGSVQNVALSCFVSLQYGALQYYSISSVNTPSACTSFGEQCFRYSKIKILTFPVSKIVQREVCAYCSCLETVCLPHGIEVIDESAFYICDNLSDVTFPSSLIVIKKNAFFRCKSLGSLHSLSISFIDENAFRECSRLTTIALLGDVSVIGPRCFRNCTSLRSVVIKGHIDAINDETFYACYNLCTVDIPKTISAIKKNAFSNCYALRTIACTNNVRVIETGAFQYCYNLEKFIFSKELEYIGSSAFSNCYSLRDVDMFQATRLTRIENGAFRSAGSLRTITFPDNLHTIASESFSSCTSLTSVVLPIGLYVLGNNAFSNNPSLTSADLSRCMSLEAIGDSAFRKDVNLVDVKLPEGLLTIGMSSFEECASIKQIEIPASLVKVDDRAFYGCSSLRHVRFQSGITALGHQCFLNCTSLIEIILPDSIATIGNSVFAGCTDLETVVLSNNLETIGSRGFSSCRSIRNISIPETVTEIADNVFDGCSSLSSIILPDSIRSIGREAFYKCTALTTVTMPRSLESVGIDGFANCTSLKTIWFKSETPAAAGINAFYRLPTSCLLYVPKNSLSAYTSAANYPDYNVYTYIEYDSAPDGITGSVNNDTLVLESANVAVNNTTFHIDHETVSVTDTALIIS